MLQLILASLADDQFPVAFGFAVVAVAIFGGVTVESYVRGRRDGRRDVAAKQKATSMEDFNGDC